MKKILFTLSITGLLLTGCSYFTKLNRGEKKTSPLSLELIPSEDIAIQNPNGKIQLYARAANRADASATLIVEKTFKLEKLPATISMDLPKNHERLIRPIVAHGKKISYYGTIQWDSKDIYPRDQISIRFQL